MFQRVNAAIEWGNGKVYIFGDDEYVRYDVASQTVEAGWPLPIAKHWNMKATGDVAHWTRDLDSALNAGDGKVYFFKGSQYTRFDVAGNAAEPGWPVAIAKEWNGLPKAWMAGTAPGIDAALNYWNGKVYLFKGAEYVRYDLATDKVEDGWPKAIADHWRGLWPRDLDAAVNWGDGKVYFFQGPNYARYDIASDRVDLGPRPIPPNFAGLSANGGGTRAVAWGSRVTPAFRERVIEICARLGTEPSFVMAAMAFETGRTFSPSIRNPASGATGLIQFMPATAASMGTTTDRLAAMTAEEQLNFVERYFTPFSGRLLTLADVYMAILFPAAVGRDADFALFTKPSTAYTQNAGLDRNRDGRVTKTEAEVSVRVLLAEGLTLAG